MKISILTPVYNSSAYLAECIESVMRQTHTDWEMLCVDDASTDNSLEMLKGYASTDSRIRVIALTENCGSGAARNAALPYCEGDVILTLDSDDWIADDALETIAGIFDSDEQTDCVLTEALWYYNENDIRPFQSKSDKTCFSGEEAFLLSVDWSIHGIYAARRAVYERYTIDDSCKFYSDDNTTRIHFLQSRRVRTSHARYYYRQHSESVSYKSGADRYMQLPALLNLKKEAAAMGASDEGLRAIDEFTWRNVMGEYMRYYTCRSHYTDDERYRIRSVLRECYRLTDTRSLPITLRLRFGYAPIKWCPPLYRLQMLLFTKIRRIIGKDIGRFD